MFKYLIIISCCISLSLSQSFPLSINSWSEKDFVDRFLGNFGVLTSLEPKISQEEAKLLKETSALLSKQGESSIDLSIKKLLEFTKSPKRDAKSSSAAIYFVLGQLYLQKRDYKSSIKYLSEAIKLFPNFYRAYKSLSMALIQAQDYNRAFKMTTKALDLKGGDRDLYNFIGYIAFLNKDYYISSKAYETALMLSPDTLSYKIGLASALDALGKHKDSIGVLQSIIESKETKDIDIYLLKQANSFLALKDYDNALLNLYIALQGKNSKESFKEANKLLAKLYLQQGLYRESAQIYENLMKRQSSLSLLKDAIAAFKYMIREKDVAYAKAYLKNLHSVYQKHYKRDKDTLQKDLFKEGSFEIQLLNLEAKLYSLQGKKDRAHSVYKRIIALDPLHIDATLEIIKHLAHKEKFIDADIYCNRLYSSKKRLYEIFFTCANINIQSKNYPEALKLLKRSYAINENKYLLSNINELKRIVNTQQ